MLLANTWNDFDPSGHLVSQSATQSTQSPFLILGVVLIIVWFLLTAMFVYYLYQFMRTKSDTKLYGRTMLYVNLGINIVNLLFSLLTLCFWARGQQIFGDVLDAADKTYNACTAFAVIGFVLLAAQIIMMWFFLPYYGIAFDDKRILFMGEDIPYQSITKIVTDKTSGDTYINYTRGKRAHKRLKFSAASAFGLFIKKNATLTGHLVEEADEKAYYQSLMNSDKVAEKAFDKQVNNKIKNKSARNTSAPSKSKSKSTSNKSKSKNK